MLSKKTKAIITFLSAVFIAALFCIVVSSINSSSQQNSEYKKRIVIVSDLQGGDEDDYQSLVHYLLYSDLFNTRGIVNGTPKRVPSTRIDKVLKAYNKDYFNLHSWSPDYPTPEYLKKVFVSGATKPNQSNYTSGSKLIVKEAKLARESGELLHVLVWGAITDVMLALKQDEAIKSVLRIYFIAGWNGDQDKKAYSYVRNVKNIHLVENVTTFRGIYLTGLGSQAKYGNVGFVKKVLRPKGGALGKFFYRVSEDIGVNSYGIKMGDTPSVLFALNGDSEDPTKDSWGGSFCKTSKKNVYTDCKDSKIGSFYGAGRISKHRSKILRSFENRAKRAHKLNLLID